MRSPVIYPPFPKPRPLPPLTPELDCQGIALPPARRSDLPLFAEFHAASRMAELALLPWPPAEKRAFLDQQFALQHAHYVRFHRKGDFRLVTRGGTTLGRFYFDRNQAEWLVIDILLDQPAQGSGLGTSLLSWLQSGAAAAGAAGVRLSVMHNNLRAQALYRRLGFLDTGETTPTHRAMIWRA